MRLSMRMNVHSQFNCLKPFTFFQQKPEPTVSSRPQHLHDLIRLGMIFFALGSYFSHATSDVTLFQSGDNGFHVDAWNAVDFRRS